MIYKRGQTYWYKFNWSIRQRDGCQSLSWCDGQRGQKSQRKQTKSSMSLDTTFAALSDATRRAMIERLSHGPASVHGLTEPFALSQQMISKHIAYLVRARIVIKTKRGRGSVCTLRPEAIKTVSDWAISYRRFWEESFDKLDVVVNQMKKAEVRDDKKHG
jgi:DNA-binding transcriptional ArsR family regulator